MAPGTPGTLAERGSSTQNFSSGDKTTPLAISESRDDVEIILEDPTDEAVVLPSLPNPYNPTAEEVRQHELTHLPYRSWCSHCVRGCGKSLPHKQLKDVEKSIPTVGIDYAFLDGEDHERNLLIMVMRDSNTKVVFSNVVPCKGT